MAETKNNDERFPEVKPTKPGNDTAYIAPIIGKLGYDTRRPWLFGLGTSPNNGVDFHVFLSFDGLNFDDNDIDKIWNGGTADKVKKEVDSATAEIPAAVSAANSAVSAAESAVAASKVNSDAIVAQSEAISEAKSAMDSATAEIQQTAANAASDAAKIRADVAQVQSEVDTAKAANSASVEALKSDVSAAKQDLADVHDSLTKAQSAVEQNQKLINDSVTKITSDVSATKQDLANVHDSLTKAQAAAEQNQKAIDKSIAQINDSVDATNQDLAGVRKDLTKAQADITANQKSINDNVAQINADITQDRKDIASAQQANEDTAKQLDDYSKQAAAQGKTIKSIQDKQDGFTATLADVQGNVTQVSDKVDGLSASLKDAQGNVASVKAQADQLSATLTDHAKSIATLTASAKELSSTLEDADGRLSKVEQTAKTNSSTLSDVQGDLSQVKQDATTLTATLKDTQGNISTLQQKSDSVSAQLASAQGDITTLQTGVDGIKATLASHDKTIHTLQLDSKSLKDSMADAQGDISTLQKSATSLDSEMKDHAGRLSKVEQSAATQATTLSDLQGNLTQVKQQADGLVTTLKDAQGSITQIQQKADGTLEQLKSAQGDITSLQTDVTGIKATLTDHEGDIHTLQADSKTLKDDMVDAQGNISSLQKSSTKLDSEMSSQDGRLSKVEQTAKEHTSTISDLGDKLNNLKIGGRNLLHGTSDQWRTLTYKQTYYVSTASDIYTSVVDYHGGDQFTYSATITNSSNASVRLVLYCYSGDKTTVTQEAVGPTIGPNAGAVPTQVTIKMDSITWFICGDIETLDGKPSNFSIQVKEEKLEKGNVATAWTPNPEDMATLTQVKQTADGIETTLKNAQGDIDQIRQQANGTSEQLSNVQGDVTNIQKDVDGLKQTTADNAGDIHTLQSDSKTLKDDMQDAQGDISTLKKTSTDVTSELKDHDGRISKTEQTASTLVNEFADQQDHLNRVEQTAQGTQQTVANQQGQINNIKTDASGIHETITGQGNQIATINVTLNGLSSKYEGVEKSGDELKNRLDNLSVGTRNLLHDTSDQYRTLAGSGRLEKSTASNIYTSVANYHGGDYFTYAATITNSSTKNAMLEVCLLDGNKNPLSDSGEAYPVLIHSDSVAPGIGNTRENISFQITSDTWYIRTCLVFDGDNAPAGSQVQVKDERLVEGSMAGTWSPNPDDVADKITTNSTQIDQNKKAITLKADQTTVDNLSGEVSQNKAQLKVQAGQISSKVSSTDFKTLNDKVANMKVGGRNLLHNTSDQYKTLTGNGWLYATSASDMWTSTADYSHGQQFVYSATINNTSSVPVRLALYCYGANKVGQLHKATGITVSGGISARCSVSITMDANTWFLCSDVETLDGQAPSFSVQVKDEKLEEGNVQTPWTPNPDDLITSISKNSTAIDQTNQQISLKADQKEVDKVKQTASQNSSRLNVMAGEISSKVTSTDVNNIVDKKGYATTSTVQSLITQKAGTINESITNLDAKYKDKDGVNLVRASGFHNVTLDELKKSGWSLYDKTWINKNGGSNKQGSIVIDATSITTGMEDIVQTIPLEPDTDYTLSFHLLYAGVASGKSFNAWSYVVEEDSNGKAVSPYVDHNCPMANSDDRKQNTRTFHTSKDTHQGVLYLRAMAGTKIELEEVKLEHGSVATPWTPAPSDNATVTQVQQITASIDGLQSTVANKADKSQITQLSNMIQSKVSSSDFNDLKDKTLWKSIDSIDLNTAVSQQKIFVKGGSNLPPGDYWWYVQVEPGYDSRIVQYAVSDRDNIHYSRQYDGNKWSAWSQGATESEITQLRDDINLRVKSGDLLSQINLTAHNTLIQSNKIYLDSSSTVFSGKAFIPSAAIVNLDVAKLNAGTINTDRIHIGDDSVYLSVKNNYLRLDGSNTKDKYQLRLTGNDIEFADNDSSNWEYRIQHGITKYQTDEDGLDFDVYSKRGGANHTVMAVSDAGVMISPSLFFQTDGIDSSNWMGFTRNTVDGNTAVSFHTWNDENEGFHVDCGARFMNYVYINGYARAQGWLTNSTLSKKTNIRKLDLQTALDKIRQDDQYLYEYKRNVAKGIHDPQASFIIDDIHDVAQYSVPREFIDQSGEYREPNVELAYLVAAFQALDKQVQSQQVEIKKLKEQLNND